MRQVTNEITVAVKEGSIFKKVNLRLASLHVRNLKIDDGVLYFETRIGIEKRDAAGKIVEVEGKPIIEKTEIEKVEILEDDLQLLIVDKVIIFPIIEEDEDDLE